MQKKAGFTIVEIVVVMAVIGIIASISVFGALNILKESHDKQRMASAVVVSESLEKYYSQNGEYPSVARVTASDANSVKQLLGITNIASLVAPNAQGTSTTNIWKAGAASITNKLTYSANTDTAAGCLTGNAATDVCEDYKIQYYKEKTGTIETILSRNKAVAITTPPPPVAPTINPSTTPTMNVALNGSVVTATTSATCDVGTLTQYAFRSRTNDGTWSAYGAWTTNTTTSSGTVAQGTKYGFQVKARCLAGDYPSADSPLSVEDTYIHPINTPSAPALSNSTSGNITTWSWPAVACPAGTTAYYIVNRGNDNDPSGTIGWLGWTAEQTPTTWTRDTTSQGYNYTSVMKVRCGNAFATSSYSAESNYSSYLRNVVAPGGAFNWGYAVLYSRTIYRWTWSEPTCGQATAKSFQWDAYIGDVNNANGWNMYWTDKGPYYHYWYGANAPSFQDPGWYTGPVLDLEFNGASTRAGVDVYGRIKYRCQNPNTLRTAEGAWTQSPQNWT